MLRALTTAFFLLAAPLALAQPGTPDPTFATDGVYTLEAQESGATQVLVRPDGGVFAVGQIEGEVAVVALGADGTPDASFGTDGVGRFPDSEGFIALGAALLADGGLVLSGARVEDDDTPGAAALFKMSAVGVPEASFGTNGVATYEGELRATGLVAVREVADGGLSSGGTYASADGAETGMLSARFTASGEFDGSYGTDGVVLAPSGSGLAAFSGRYDASGALYIHGGVSTGLFTTGAGLARVLPSGELDASFGSDGVVTLSAGLPFALVLSTTTDASGRVVGAGTGLDFTTRASEAFVFRLRTDGSLDPGFASGGLFRTTAGQPLAQALTVATDSDGAVLYGGVSGTEAQPRPFVGRLDPGGAPEASFGTGGFAQVPFGEPALGARIALQPDGKILVVGQIGDGNADPTGVLVARLRAGLPILSAEPGAETSPLALSLAGPNPIGLTTALAIEATQPLAARVAAYDALGREVAVLHSGPLAAGRTALTFDASGLAPGAYLVRASAGGASVTIGVVKR